MNVYHRFLTPFYVGTPQLALTHSPITPNPTRARPRLHQGAPQGAAGLQPGLRAQDPHVASGEKLFPPSREQRPIYVVVETPYCKEYHAACKYVDVFYVLFLNMVYHNVLGPT